MNINNDENNKVVIETAFIRSIKKENVTHTNAYMYILRIVIHMC